MQKFYIITLLLDQYNKIKYETLNIKVSNISLGD
ncbi:hypothetical protein pb186bvf_012720 [Paramecium bursaria]